MAKSQQDIQQTGTFIKGLITEQSALSSAPESFSDGLNVLIDVRGATKKRKGIDYESGHGIIPVGVDARTVAASVGRWNGVNGNPDLNLIVIQLGTRLLFLDAALASPSSELFASTDFGGICVDVAKAQASRSQFASSSGSLIMTNPGTDPLHIEYSEDEDGVPAINIYRIYLKVRDFVGIADGLRLEETPASLSAAHHYNLKNQGWVSVSDVSGVEDETDNGGSQVSEPTIPVTPTRPIKEITEP